MPDDTASSITADAYPLDWPLGRERTDEPQSANFYVRGDRRRKPKPVGEAHEKMMDEIRRLAKDEGEELDHALFSSNIKRRKRDGLPYANARQPDDAGVALYFQIGGEQRCFACDRWDRVADNMWAIGRTIGAIRQIGRDGAGRDFHAAYDAATGLLPQETGGVSCYDVFGITREATEEEIERAFRAKAKQVHPDVKSGVAEDWHRLQEARQQALAAVDD